MCRDYPCPEYTFRCLYGGCIHQEVVCDGIKDCIDATDEDPDLCAAMNCEGKKCSQYKCRLIICDFRNQLNLDYNSIYQYIIRKFIVYYLYIFAQG
jgi:hypothetical protein